MNISDPVLRAAIMLRDDGVCRYCGMELDGEDVDSSPAIDHVIPQCQGGSDDISNLALSCRRCNSSKGGRTPIEAGMVLKSPRGEFDFAELCALEFGIGLDEKQATRIVVQLQRERSCDLCYILEQCKSRSERRLFWSMTRIGSPITSFKEEIDETGVYLSLWHTKNNYHLRQSEDGTFRIARGSGHRIIVSVCIDNATLAQQLVSSAAPALNFTSREIEQDGPGCWCRIIQSVNSWTALFDRVASVGFTTRGVAIERINGLPWTKFLNEETAEAAE